LPGVDEFLFVDASAERGYVREKRERIARYRIGDNVLRQ
jgi:hypothetical protein